MRRLLLVVAVALACTSAASAYPWPIKPFDRQHPIRGFFGDPRTVYQDGILADAFAGPSVTAFHQGVDIAAPNGTPVYAVEDGAVHYLGASTLNLVTDHGVTFQYFHVIPVAGEGQQAVARQTVLGYVQPPYGHVHITEIDFDPTVGVGRAVNPLQRGHLTPYRDRTVPQVRDVVVRNQLGDVQTPLGLCGRIELDVDAYDPQPLPVPGVYRGLPVAPALVQWWITRAGGKVVVPLRTEADFRRTLPPNGQFFDVYAQGTYENSPRFGAQQYAGMPGRYLFLLAGNFDTASLPNGTYVISVRVADVRGNRSVGTERVSILNSAKPGACPGSLPAPPGSEAPPTEPAPSSGGQP